MKRAELIFFVELAYQTLSAIGLQGKRVVSGLQTLQEEQVLRVEGLRARGGELRAGEENDRGGSICHKLGQIDHFHLMLQFIVSYYSVQGGPPVQIAVLG